MARYIFAMLALLLAGSILANPEQPRHVEWSRNASIYEVNIRQYTPEGTINAFAKHLPRLQKMGVKILWVMPVQPIGEKNRKGSLGSYYAIRDYTAVNPEFGTMADFQAMVTTAHKLKMKVILDWVANHTAWDSKWAVEHPEWFKRNAKGELTSYEFDNGREIEYWTDVIGLDYRVPAVWDAQIAALKYWVSEGGVDGFRADVASLMPIPFWQRARRELDAIKPVFMLAESNDPAIHSAFDMTYDWSLWDTFAEIAQGKGNADTLRLWLKDGQAGFPADAYRMSFTSNHDINSWRYSDRELFGDKFRAFAVLAATLPGMPLVYSGQESGLDKKIAFFEKDAIVWRQYDNADFYQRLLKLKAHNAALANGAAGAPVELLDAGDTQLLAFRRAKGKAAITVVVNLSDQPRAMKAVTGMKTATIPPWGYAVADGARNIF